MKDFEEIFKEECRAVAVQYKLGFSLVTGHKSTYWTEAAKNAAEKYVTQELEKIKEQLIERKMSYKDQVFTDQFINGRFWEVQEIIEKLQKILS
jgi:hypothetical protein